MDSLLPKIKTVRVMLKDFSEQQEAIFRMAFKMHNTTNYEVVTEGSGQKPDMVLVDIDNGKGILPWQEMKKEYPDIIKDVRGKSLLIAVELADDNTTATINSKCLDNGLILNVTQGNIIRMFPALNISKEEMEEGLNIFKDALYEFKER